MFSIDMRNTIELLVMEDWKYCHRMTHVLKQTSTINWVVAFILCPQCRFFSFLTYIISWVIYSMLQRWALIRLIFASCWKLRPPNETLGIYIYIATWWTWSHVWEEETHQFRPLTFLSGPSLIKDMVLVQMVLLHVWVKMWETLDSSIVYLNQRNLDLLDGIMSTAFG